MGTLISVEGGEFVGKTSLVANLARVLKSKGINVKTAREPGTTLRGEEIRLLVNEVSQNISPLDLVKLFFESRKHLVEEVLIPTLGLKKEKDVVVILDRYIDSTRVYQGLEGGVDLSVIKNFEEKYLAGFYPDFTVILYFPPKKFKQIIQERMAKTRVLQSRSSWERDDLRKQLQRQRFFLQIPNISKKWRENRKFLLIDSTKSPEEVTKKVLDLLDLMGGKSV